MNKSIEFGNLAEKAKTHRGWVVGHFIEKDDLLHSEAVEIKYHLAKKGETNESFAAVSEAHTLSVLMRGRFRLLFPEHGSEYILENEGDFVFWNPLVQHGWEVLEDTLLITVRWPSRPNS